MADKKLIAMVVMVVVIAGISAGFIFNNNSDNSSDTMKYDGRLMILGNADNDDDIDGEDISTLKDIISSGEWDKKLYPYADANKDGEVNQSDIDLVAKMINKEKTTIYYINCNDEIKTVVYPVNDIVIVGTYAANVIVELGLCDKTVGISGSKHWNDSDYWGDLNEVPQISTSSIHADFEFISKLENVDIIVTTQNGVDNESDFNAAGIDVVRLDFGGNNEIGAILILGYLTGMTERAGNIVSFYDDIRNKAAKLNEKFKDSEKKTVFTVYSQNWVYGDPEKHGEIAGKCAAINRYHYDGANDNGHRKILGGDEWLLNDEWRSDCILGQEKWLYSSGIDVVGVWKGYERCYSGMDAFPKNVAIVNDSMAEPVKMAYIMEYLYPDEFEERYGDKIHQKFIDEFVDCLSGSYDVRKDGVFFVTYDDIKNKL